MHHLHDMQLKLEEDTFIQRKNSYLAPNLNIQTDQSYRTFKSSSRSRHPTAETMGNMTSS